MLANAPPAAQAHAIALQTGPEPKVSPWPEGYASKKIINSKIYAE
jgi:hypothetical protein